MQHQRLTDRLIIERDRTELKRARYQRDFIFLSLISRLSRTSHAPSRSQTAFPFAHTYVKIEFISGSSLLSTSLDYERKRIKRQTSAYCCWIPARCWKLGGSRFCASLSWPRIASGTRLLSKTRHYKSAWCSQYWNRGPT